ncbi:hypothetical protein BS50DRAFT_625870 [Corynespora cassiicola Philippines]|uniref:Uncharacterized protein n=1 Tax=Corynespora cassiicola Philippines TaxID=1448308 RepID=A0A2T2N4X6_CORCC|nr:hypothetical protein BS50DRAFT_625870 [Corynespora cassiicola Philippines]
MTTKKVLGPHAISTLKEQTRRFECMSVCLAKGADLATSQANEIAEWASKLIIAVTAIQQEVENEAAAYRAQTQNKIRALGTQADSRKRKILDDGELDSSRTIKANLRLIFGPFKEGEYVCNKTKHAHSTTLRRIKVIRGLTSDHPHGVIAFLLAHSSKVWAESSWQIFNGLIESLKNETEQPWPDEIVEIMNELREERPMSAEFGSLQGTSLSHLLGKFD